MHLVRPTRRFRPSTRPWLIAALVLVCAACAAPTRRPGPESPTRRVPEGGTVTETGEELSAAASVEGPAPEPTEATLAEPDDPDAAAAGVSEDEALPGEEVTESPLDQIADVAPEIDPEELVEEREIVEALVPAYDLPMVTNDKVLFWIDYYTNRRKEEFGAGLARSGRYLRLFRRIFEERDLPQDLVYMAHVESGYKTTAYSRARARGIFQFIASTGRRYGLRIDYWVDERLDPEKSAYAAAAYLRKLYDEFGDWHLALAAYNAGEGKIRSALRRSGRDDFWGIAKTRYIRRETRNYVPAILAAIMISKQPERYGFEFEPDSPVLYETVEIEGAVDLQVLAKCSGTDLSTMKLLNPALRRYQTPPHARTAVHLPPGRGERTLAELERIPPDERVLYVRHRVRAGDTLYDLARGYGVTVSAIQQANRMGRRTVIRVGQVLTIPTVAAGSYPAAESGAHAGPGIPGEAFTYRVRRGDTLSRIARRHGTTPAAIAAASRIGVNEVLQIGRRLTVVPGVRSAGEARRIALDGAPVPASGRAVVHTVRRGESLSLIARRYGTTPEAIAAANGIRVSKLLQIGEKLRVDPGGPGGRVHDGDGAVVHTVRRGESLWTIARRYSTTIEAICQLNRISRSATLYPGTRLTVSVP